MIKSRISFNCNPNSSVLLRVLDYYKVSSNTGPSGVRNYILRRLNTTAISIGTSPNTLKAFL